MTYEQSKIFHSSHPNDLTHSLAPLKAHAITPQNRLIKLIPVHQLVKENFASLVRNFYGHLHVPN